MSIWDGIALEFSAGERTVKRPEELSFAEILLANRLPPSLFQAYDVNPSGTYTTLPITAKLSDVPEGHRVALRCIRNTEIDSLKVAEFETVRRDPSPVVSLLDVQPGRPGASNKIHLIDEHTLRQVVFSKIEAFLSEHDVVLPLVAGISGGGDSNTLVWGIKKYVRSSTQDAGEVTCFTLVMDPIWPESAAERAQRLCAEAGFRHWILQPQDVVELMEMSASVTELWRDFSAQYGADTSHFFATMLINLVGRRICKEVSARHLAVGYNREDIVAELLFCLMNGRQPMPFPVRGIGETTCLFPVWDIPKHMLDACYPKYSEQNYRERIDVTTVQRSTIYFVAHCLDALVPQLSASLLSGVAKLMNATGGWERLSAVPGTPLVDTGHGDDAAQAHVLTLLRRYFPTWT